MKKEYDGITLDLFGTLVVQELGSASFHDICDGFALDRESVLTLGTAFEPELRKDFRALLDRSIGDHEEFPTLESMFEAAFTRLSNRLQLEIDAAVLAERLIRKLGQAPAFAETEPVLQRLEQDYRLCIVSDGDIEMVRGALRCNGLDRFPAIISEEHRAYKITRKTPLFPRALEILGTSAERTLHVGDQASDVYGAHQCGLDCVRINRTGRPLPEGIPSPIAEVPDLESFIDWLTERSG